MDQLKIIEVHYLKEQVDTSKPNYKNDDTGEWKPDPMDKVKTK